MDNQAITVQFLAGARDLSLLESIQVAPKSTQPPIQWVAGTLSPRAKWLNSPHLHRALTLKMELYLHSPTCLHGVHKDNFTFTYLTDNIILLSDVHAPQITICTHLKVRQNLVQQLIGNFSRHKHKERKKKEKMLT
jgi:hypothetical protein